jgi:uncharacterized protein YbjQ (UPF0145 family)
MSETCAHCGSKISQAGIFSNANLRVSDEDLRMVNFVNGSDHAELCDNCGGELREGARARLSGEREQLKTDIEARLSFFPTLTVGVLPQGNAYRAIGLVTANVTVGTGLFNEISQGVSDMFGAVNQSTGMAFKVNKGEAIAKAILVRKALELGANCIIGTDIDYGTTTNNAATVNMQGTAVLVPDLAAILGGRAHEMTVWILWAWSRVQSLSRWLRGDIQPGDTLATE